MHRKRRGSWIETYGGVKFWPLSPKADEVKEEDITHSLCLQCRFAGHTKWFYSVGQHSNNCYWVARALYPNWYDLHVWVVGHDDSEAYVGDLPRPIKWFIKAYKPIEYRVQKVIWQAQGVKPPTQSEWKFVKYIDDMVLRVEGLRLMNNIDGWVYHLPTCDASIESLISTDEEPWRKTEEDFTRNRHRAMTVYTYGGEW